MTKEPEGPPDDPIREHHAAARRRPPAAICVITLSDSRGEADDRSGAYLRRAVVDGGDTLLSYRLLPDDAPALRSAIAQAVESRARVVLCTGGTGIGPRDITVETVEPLFDRRLPGFGELFRQLSYQQVGAAAMLSRATAGQIGRCLLFALPGSPKAVELAWTALIAPELGHLVGEMDRDSSASRPAQPG